MSSLMLATTFALLLMLASQVEAAMLDVTMTKFRYVAVCSVGYSVEIARYDTVRDETSCSSLCESNTACQSFVYRKNESYCSLKDAEIIDMTFTGCPECLMQVYGEPMVGLLPRFTKLRCKAGNGGCTTSVNNFRLCDGGGPGVCDVTQGRLEVYHDCQWGSVCDDWWDWNGYIYSANVTCKMFGFSGGSHHCCAHFGKAPSTFPIWLDDVKCTGNEKTLHECPHLPFGTHNCAHHEDVGVVCY